MRIGRVLHAGAVIFLFLTAAALAALAIFPPRGDPQDAGSPGRGELLALPRASDLTLGTHAGESLLGVTFRPARPGPNQILVYVLPIEGDEGAAPLPLTLSLRGTTTELEVCGPTCRQAEVQLTGGERITVSVGGPQGGRAALRVPTLPALDASSIYARMQERMHDLQTYRIQETLNSGRATVRAEYAFMSPDRMRIRMIDGPERIVVRDQQWTRERPGAPWERGRAVVPDVPSFIWDSGRDPVALKLVDSEEIGGIRTKVISFLGGAGTPIWFRLWIDKSGLVRKAEMRAHGHFMDHRYLAFGAPLQIRPPSEAGRR